MIDINIVGLELVTYYRNQSKKSLHHEAKTHTKCIVGAQLVAHLSNTRQGFLEHATPPWNL